jgi:hypothetical protein
VQPSSEANPAASGSATATATAAAAEHSASIGSEEGVGHSDSTPVTGSCRSSVDRCALEGESMMMCVCHCLHCIDEGLCVALWWVFRPVCVRVCE